MNLDYNPASLFFQIFDSRQGKIYQLQNAKRFGVWAAILGSETGFWISLSVWIPLSLIVLLGSWPPVYEYFDATRLP